jgi:hypothetical protein
MPPAQEETSPGPVAQARPQLPQFVKLVPVLTSQPLPMIRSQSAKPATHANVQTPDEQTDVALALLGQDAAAMPSSTSPLQSSSASLQMSVTGSR